MAEFEIGDKARSRLFYGIAEVISLVENARGKLVATVRLDKDVFQPSIPDDTCQCLARNLRPSDLPGYDIEFTASPRYCWLTPRVAEQVRGDSRIGSEIQHEFDQVLVETALDSDEWANGIGEMA